MTPRDAVVDPSVVFERFYTAHRDRLVRLLAADLGDVQLAADAVDTAMSRAWARWHRLTDHDDAGAWVYRVARNWATSWFRRQRWRSGRPVPDQPTHDATAVDTAGVRQRLDTLSADHRAVVVLRVLGGYSTAETAAALDVPEGTVQSRLARALDRLRDLEGDR